MRSGLGSLAAVPLDQLLAQVNERFRTATLDELIAFLRPRASETLTVAGSASVVSARVPSSAATRVDHIADDWSRRYGLTGAEADILLLAARGKTRDAIARARRRSPATVKTQVQRLLKKVKAGSLHVAVQRLLREAMASY